MRPSQASETCSPAHVTPPSSPPPLRVQRACVSSTRSVPPPATLRRRVSRGRLRRPPVFFALRTRGGQPAGRGGARRVHRAAVGAGGAAQGGRLGTGTSGGCCRGVRWPQGAAAQAAAPGAAGPEARETDVRAAQVRSDGQLLNR